MKSSVPLLPLDYYAISSHIARSYLPFVHILLCSALLIVVPLQAAPPAESPAVTVFTAKNYAAFLQAFNTDKSVAPEKITLDDLGMLAIALQATNGWETVDGKAAVALVGKAPQGAAQLAALKALVTGDPGGALTLLRDYEGDVRGVVRPLRALEERLRAHGFPAAADAVECVLPNMGIIPPSFFPAWLALPEDKRAPIDGYVLNEAYPARTYGRRLLVSSMTDFIALAPKAADFDQSKLLDRLISLGKDDGLVNLHMAQTLVDGKKLPAAARVARTYAELQGTNIPVQLQAADFLAMNSAYGEVRTLSGCHRPPAGARRASRRSARQ